MNREEQSSLFFFIPRPKYIAMALITKELILKYVSQEDIFKLVFDEVPNNNRKVKSPFRKDNKPGCFFSYYKNKLRFIDFADEKNHHRDCFHVVQEYYGLANFKETMQVLYEHFVVGKNIPKTETVIRRDKERCYIDILPRDFTEIDKQFWQPYGISSYQLREDNVFSVSKYDINKITMIPKDNCYSFCEFNENRKRIYQPYKKGVGKFITNCSANDIGGLNTLPYKGEQLIISKSYKDCRVLRNQGLNSIWMQSETVMPDIDNFVDICNRFPNIVVFFDNDKAGIQGARKLQGMINQSEIGVASTIHLPVGLEKDPSDIMKKRGESCLREFVNEKIKLL